MFHSKNIAKIIPEYYKSLIEEYSSIKSEIPKSLKKNSDPIFQIYTKNHSLAGMETILVNIHEYNYFQSILDDLLEYKDSSLEDLSEFHVHLLKSIELDFREEDYRFVEIERLKPTYNLLSKKISDYKNEAEQNIIHLKEDLLIPESFPDYSTYYKVKKSPSTIGLKVETKKKFTPKSKIKQLKLAEANLRLLWLEGHNLYKLLTNKIILVQSKNLVSYTHFHEQGISYLNILDRNFLETIDDLVHENAHHHLNLILKKYKLIQKEYKEHVFYSPWRRTLRSLYGILHASFTFTYGARLFYEILTSSKLSDSALSKDDVELAKVRFIEETYMLDYSLFDLKWGIKNDLFTKNGIELIETIEMNISEYKKLSNKILKTILSKSDTKKLVSLKEELDNNRKLYKLSKKITFQ